MCVIGPSLASGDVATVDLEISDLGAQRATSSDERSDSVLVFVAAGESVELQLHADAAVLGDVVTPLVSCDTIECDPSVGEVERCGELTEHTGGGRLIRLWTSTAVRSRGGRRRSSGGGRRGSGRRGGRGRARGRRRAGWWRCRGR